MLDPDELVKKCIPYIWLLSFIYERDLSCQTQLFSHRNPRLFSRLSRHALSVLPWTVAAQSWHYTVVPRSLATLQHSLPCYIQDWGTWTLLGGLSAQLSDFYRWYRGLCERAPGEVWVFWVCARPRGCCWRFKGNARSSVKIHSALQLQNSAGRQSSKRAAQATFWYRDFREKPTCKFLQEVSLFRWIWDKLVRKWDVSSWESVLCGRKIWARCGACMVESITGGSWKEFLQSLCTRRREGLERGMLVIEFLWTQFKGCRGCSDDK